MRCPPRLSYIGDRTASVGSSTLRLADGLELLALRVVSEQFRGNDLKIPAVNLQRTVRQAILHAGITVQVVEREENVFPAGRGDAFGDITDPRIFLFHPFADR